KRLLLNVRQQEVAIIAADVRLAGRGHPAWLGRAVTLAHLRDHYGEAVNGPVFYLDAHRRDEPARLGRQALLEGPRIGERNWAEASPLVQSEDDRAAAGQVSQGTQRRGQALGKPARGSLDLYAGDIASCQPQAGHHCG